MAFAYTGNGSAYLAAGTEVDWTATIALGDLIVVVYAFQNVGSSSGPWSIPNTGQFSTAFIGPAEGWQQACWQAPSATGVGIEVWCAINGAAGSQVRKLALASSQQCQVALATYSGAYAPNGSIRDGAVRAATTAQVVGNQPAAPSIYAFANELVVAVAGDLMTGAGFGTPAGYTNRIDAAGGGAGNAEATVADAVAQLTGLTGLITFPNNAASGATAGTTATLAIRGSSVATPANAVQKAGMPENLDLGNGYTVRLTALDPTSGAPVPGVTVANLAMEVVDVNNSGSGLVDSGDFKLVPGPGA